MYAIRAGATLGYKTLAGLQYTRDANYTTQGPTNGVSTVTDPIANTDDDALYQGQRYGMFTYDLPVAPDCYLVTLNINEQWATGVGQRKMSVAAEGVTLVNNVDLFATYGKNTAINLDFKRVCVADGRLTLNFTASVNFATLSGIVVRTGSEVPPFSGSSSSSSSSSSSTSSGGTGKANYLAKCDSCHQVGAPRDIFVIARGKSAGDLTTIILNTMSAKSIVNNTGACTGDCATSTAAYVVELLKAGPPRSSSSSSSSSSASSGGNPGNPVTGAAIYKAQCLDCHGAKGVKISAGGDAVYALNVNDKTLSDLVTKISTSMPKGGPQFCTGACAQDVSAYLNTWRELTPLTCDATKPLTYGVRAFKVLTRSEYQNTLVDLLGLLPKDYSRSLVLDNTKGHFPNNSATNIDSLSLSNYWDNAKEIAKWAVANGKPFVCNANTNCANTFVTTFLPKVFRRSLSAAEVTSYTALFTTYPGVDGMEVALSAALSSPSFLYRSEMGNLVSDIRNPPTGTTPLAKGNVVKLNQAATTSYMLSAEEFASSLSYTLTGSMPDDILMTAARAGGLDSDAGVLTQVNRLLDSPKGRRQMGAFAGYWFDTDRVVGPDGDRDPAMFPTYTADVRTSMAEEVRELFRTVFYDQTLPFEQFYAGDFAVFNKVLAGYYGVANPSTSADQWVKSANVPNRGGLLTTGAFMTVNAHPDKSSPIKRVVRIREQVLCQHIEPPPMFPVVNGVDPRAEQLKLAEAENASGIATTRRYFETITNHELCDACHKLKINPAFGMEDFDQVGQWRNTQRGATGMTLSIDNMGRFYGPDNINDEVTNLVFAGAKDLSNKLSKVKSVQSCMVEKSFRYVTGLPNKVGAVDAVNDAPLTDEQKSDFACSVSQATQAFETNNHSPRAVMTKLVTQDLMRFKK